MDFPTFPKRENWRSCDNDLANYGDFGSDYESFEITVQDANDWADHVESLLFQLLNAAEAAVIPGDKRDWQLLIRILRYPGRPTLNPKDELAEEMYEHDWDGWQIRVQCIFDSLCEAIDRGCDPKREIKVIEFRDEKIVKELKKRGFDQGTENLAPFMRLMLMQNSGRLIRPRKSII